MANSHLSLMRRPAASIDVAMIAGFERGLPRERL